MGLVGVFRLLGSPRSSGFQLLSRQLYLCTRAQGKLDFQEDEMQKTTITLGSATPRLYHLTSLVDGGFEFGANVVHGPIALIPGSVLRWKVASHHDINVRSLSLFTLLHPRLELVIVGTGEKIEKLDGEMLEEMRKRGIAIEVQDTLNACGTYNLLRGERPGLIGAALLPVASLGPERMLDIHLKKRPKPEF